MSLESAFDAMSEAERPGAQVPKHPGTQAPRSLSTQAPKSLSPQSPRRLGAQVPKRLSTQAPKHPATEVLALQGTGKCSHPDYKAFKVYLPKAAKVAAERKHQDETDGKGDFSDLMGKLLADYLST